MRFAALSLLLLAAGCTCAGASSTGAPCETDSECTQGQTCRKGACASATDGGDDVDPFTGGMKVATALSISPASSRLPCARGTACTLQLSALATFEDGTSDTVVADWKADRPDVASIDRSGKLTATGTLGGKISITATYGSSTASATVEVVLQQVVVGPGVPANPESRFQTEAGDTSLSPTVVYPENEVVVPIDIPAPVVQWDGAAGTDLYRVTLTGPYGELVIYSVTGSAQAVEDQWRVLTEGAGGGAVKLRVEASAAGGSTYYRSGEQSILIANARFAGQIYYWALQIAQYNTGGIVRIGSDFKLDDFWRPPDPADPTNTGKRSCIACHALSLDGSKVAFTFDGGSGAGGVVNVQTPEPVAVGRGVYQANFSAFDATGQFLVNNVNRYFQLRRASDGVLVNSSFVTAPAGYAGVSQPKFSPDGKLLAYLGYMDDSWEIDYSQSDLYLTDIDGSTGTPVLSNHRRIVSGSPAPAGYAGMVALSSPTFTPDSKLLVYARGEFSRSGFDDRSILYHSKLLLTDPANPSAATELARLDAGKSRAYAPSFSPFKSGGYYWLAFMARRDYGNVVKGVNRRQIWVAAIDENPAPGKDPSHPAFWLPGQDSNTQNMTAYWAPAQCKSTSSDGPCLADIDCCSGKVCRPDGSGKSYCVPVATACKLSGDECTADGQCCTGLKCSTGSGGKKTCSGALK